MGISTEIAIYFLIWWIALFAVLPWGVRAQGEENAAPGTDPGAPTVPRVLLKLLWTTIVATVLWGAFFVVYSKGWVSIDGLTRWMGMPQS